MHFFSIFPKHSEFPGVIQNTWKIQHLTSKIFFLEASKNIQARMGLIHGPIQYSIWRKSSGNHGLGYLFKVYTFTRLKRTDKIKLMLCLFLLLGVKKELYFFFVHRVLLACSTVGVYFPEFSKKLLLNFIVLLHWSKMPNNKQEMKSSKLVSLLDPWNMWYPKTPNWKSTIT